MYHFDVFADYRQLYLDDCALHDELTRLEGRDPMARAEEISAWVDALLSPDAHARHLGGARGTLCILTARNFTVPLDIEIRPAPLPQSRPQDFAGWDHVAEAGLDLPSGCLLVHGATDGLDENGSVAVAPGMYRARVYYGASPP